MTAALQFPSMEASAEPRRCVQHGVRLDAEGECALCAIRPARRTPIAEETAAEDLRNALMMLDGGDRFRADVRRRIESALRKIEGAS